MVTAYSRGGNRMHVMFAMPGSIPRPLAGNGSRNRAGVVVGWWGKEVVMGQTDTFDWVLADPDRVAGIIRRAGRLWLFPRGESETMPG